MTSVCVTREYNIKVGSDFYLRTHPKNPTNESDVSVGFHDLDQYISANDLDLAYIAAGLFACEGLWREKIIDLTDTITLLVNASSKLRESNAGARFEDLIAFTLKEGPKIRIIGVKARQPTPSKKITAKFGSCTLFSGGIDSLSGILTLGEKLKPTVGIFVSHDRMSSKVDLISERILKSKKIHVHSTRVQRRAGMQQLRGFVYLIFGAITARIHNTNRVVICETGQTMFQPQLTAIDEVTVTTHPTLVAMTRDLLKQTYGTEFEFYEPFANLTKAEVVSLCPAKEVIPQTHSCFTTTRFANQPVSHCGKCFACLIRRAACIVAGVNDSLYAKDVLTKDVGDTVIGGWPGKRILGSDLSSVQSMLRFARDILEDKLDDVSRFQIESFAKQDLYHRFALDIMSSLSLLYDKGGQGRNSWVKRYYLECKHDKVITPDSAANRIAEVRGQRFQPNFETKL